MTQSKEDKGTVCFTGKLKNFTRTEAQAKAMNAGYSVCDNVTEHWTDYLVVADPNSNSGKVKKAKKWNVKVISEDEFLQMCDLDKAEVEKETEWRKEHKEKEVLTWGKCCKKLCKQLGLICKSQSHSSPNSDGTVTKSYRTCIFFDDKKKYPPMVASSDDYIWEHSDDHSRRNYWYLAESRDESFKAVLKSLFSLKAPKTLLDIPSDHRWKDLAQKLPNDNGFETLSQFKLLMEINGYSVI